MLRALPSTKPTSLATKPPPICLPKLRERPIRTCGFWKPTSKAEFRYGAIERGPVPRSCLSAEFDRAPRSSLLDSRFMSDATNSLSQASSAYLRSAMRQPIQWHEWGAEAFATAQRENKPILLDIGAVWCHWCHVMDRESYDDPEIAAIVNEHFIAVKVDRDERPDIDSRYQAAVQAVSGQGGWPLTAFLTPDGKPFYGGTYFPPSDGYGRPSFRRVLLSIANAYKEKNGDVVEQAKMLESAI